MTDTLVSGRTLAAGEELTSSNGNNRLVMQHDGNLVIYTPRGARWDTGTWSLPAVLRPSRLEMQGDGNLVLYSNINSVGWSPNIHGRGGSRLVMQDDENLVVYRTDGTAVWATNTHRASDGSAEIKASKATEVAWAKHSEVWATLYRDGSLVVNTKHRCDAPFSGYKPRTFVIAIDDRARQIWSSQTLVGETLCALFDPTCASSGTDTFQESWPSEIASRTKRLDIYASDSGIFDKWREQIKKAGEAAEDLKETYDKFWK